MGLRKLKIARPTFSHRTQAKDDDLICVTGSWSFLGSWIVKLLLHHGYHVKSTIPHTPEEIRVLRSLPQSETTLELAEVDLLDYGSLSDLFTGCTGVFYVPSPNYDINGTRDYPVEIVNNEVRGVLNVVEACANTSSIRKLVLTSCLSSIMWDRQYYSTGVVLDEKNWSDMDFCRKEKMWAALCKTQSEKAAWALARDRGLDLVVMNPAVVAGPRHSCGQTNSSMLDQSGIFAFVHVDDLAAAHVLAFEAEHASGRYICFEKLLSKADILEAAREMYPDYPIAKRGWEVFDPLIEHPGECGTDGLRFVVSLSTSRDSRHETISNCHRLPRKRPRRRSHRMWPQVSHHHERHRERLQTMSGIAATTVAMNRHKRH